MKGSYPFAIVGVGFLSIAIVIWFQAQTSAAIQLKIWRTGPDSLRFWIILNKLIACFGFAVGMGILLLFASDLWATPGASP